MNINFEVRSEKFLNLKFRTFELWKSKIQNFQPPLLRISATGFTLVEIMVAISILAIISAVSIPNLNGFNEDQILQNTTGDLIRILREAQSSANSHIQCTDTLIAKEWVVEISGNSYTLKANCYNPKTNAIQTDIRYTPTAVSTSGVGIATGTQHGLNCNAIFSAEYKPYDQNRFSSITFSCTTPAASTDNVMEITLTKTGLNPQYICIDKGGSINASTTACF